MRAPNSRTDESPALCVAIRPNSTSAIPPCAALAANFGLSFADEHANINSGATTHIGAAKPISFRHIVRNLALRGIFRRWGCSASILNAKRLLRNRTENTRSTSGTGIMSNANAADATALLIQRRLEHQLQLGDGVSTGSGRDRVAIPPITIRAIRCDPV